MFAGTSGYVPLWRGLCMDCFRQQEVFNMRRNFVHSLSECMASEAMKDGLFSLAAAYRKKKEDEDEDGDGE